MLSDPICLRVKGPFACFTRPEFHVERVSYPVITPSAARGILEAILMKPIEKPEAAQRHDKFGFRWQVLRIGVVKKGTLFPLLRNELGYEQHPAYGNATGYDINATSPKGRLKNRAQRHSLILRDVEYLIEAVIEVSGIGHRVRRANDGKRLSEEFLARNKYHHMFLRRARAGQCCYQPFLGCREFSASEWDLVETPPDRIPGAQEEDDFGLLFRDFDFDNVWKHWGHEEGVPRPPGGWADHDHRPVPRRPLHAKAACGWITVASILGGRVVPTP